MALANDSGYRLLFSHPVMVEHLLRGFVPQAWVQAIDFTSLEPWRGDHVADDLTERREDLVWRVRLQGERWLYVYLLLEFQSRSDPWMALRMLSYVALLYQNLIRHDPPLRPGDLPPVFPLVVHHGAQPWSAAREMSALFAPAPDPLNAYRPSLRYFVLDAHRAQPTTLGENVIDHLIALERSATPQAVRSSIIALRRCLAASRHDSLRRAFTVYIHRIVLRRLVPAAAIPEVNDLQELDAMLAERVEEWTKTWEQQGIEKGIEKGIERGIAKGRHDGRRDLLQALLVSRFGEPLPAWATSRIEQACDASIDTWAIRLLTAPSLDAVFALP